jgi:hypothetical protein
MLFLFILIFLLVRRFFCRLNRINCKRIFRLDCFLGIASCIIRLIKATVLNLVYMARLDCSFLGRPIERLGKNSNLFKTIHRFELLYLDLGFAAYVSYLHMEVTHTNPIMLGEFCRDKYFILFFFA